MEERINDNPDRGSNAPEELTIEALDEHLDTCRCLNARLDTAASDNPAHNSTRLLVFIKALLNNGKLMRVYSTLTSNLVGGAGKFLVDLRHDDEDDGEIKAKETSSPLAECEKIARMVKMNVELARLIVELTSPLEMLPVNRATVYSVIAQFEVSPLKRTNALLFNEIDADSDSDEDRRILYHKDYSVYLLKYKELFVKLDLFSTLSDNLLASFRLVHALVDLGLGIKSARMKGQIESRLKLLLVHLVDSILVNLCLARNLLIERNETVLNLVISRLLENKFDQV